MTEKDLKKLSRIELLELMVQQSRELERLKATVSQQEQQLADRSLKQEKCGNLAEAAISVNGVYEAAQEAAKQYLENIETMSARQEAISQDLIRETREECDRKREETARRCDALVIATEEHCNLMREKLSGVEQEYADRIKAADDYYAKKCAEADGCYSQKTTEADDYYAKKCAEADDYFTKKCAEADDYYTRKHTDADEYYNKRKAAAEEEVNRQWDRMSEKMEVFYQAHVGLKDMLDQIGGH